ncbi:hypothetical protein DFA_01872 [Cavenderia fasciculata]|uniref:ORC1/DEAH AAA+ ATPase domain-containing protein n=1 Tax=Cavenderia fasciculata TaxID=261658 RepID=F4PV78_CACFS|nr:uncharacterized protein DFA_01872 [Cavenderia fasciculata]EGG21986.1 hypothetical protein DFA_01872 [Cavenderia fasciculata]|eukprot:XP_004359837.1 hypothetical protein DFA_01872 [Cavenderia fasciculata]
MNNQFQEDFFLKFVLIPFTAIASPVSFVLAQGWSRSRAVLNSFEFGSFPTVTSKTYIKRDSILQKIISKLMPHPTSCLYHLIVGEHGTGKSTLLIQACHKVRKGVVYVSVPENVGAFGREIGKAFNFKYDEHVSLKAYFNSILGEAFPRPSGTSPIELFQRLNVFINEAAAAYTAKHGIPPVLIIDNINWLALRDREMLEVLQDYAKIHADKGDLVIVFVSSDGNGPVILRDRSSFSRCDKSILEIGDIPDEDAIKHLIATCKIKEESASYLVAQVTGGRFQLLNECISQIREGKTDQQIKNDTYYSVITEFEKCGINPKSVIGRSDFHSLFKKLLEEKVVKGRDVGQLIQDRNLRNRVISHNIFSCKLLGGDITFQSRAVENYVRVSKIII